MCYSSHRRQDWSLALKPVLQPTGGHHLCSQAAPKGSEALPPQAGPNTGAHHGHQAVTLSRLLQWGPGHLATASCESDLKLEDPM